MTEILLVPNPLLRQKSEKLKRVTKEDIQLSKRMIKIMKKAPGVGLAANQIGVLKQIVVVNIQDKEKAIEKTYALFNPVIKNYSKKKIIIEEGCLSLPQQFADIERPESITLCYTNEKNNNQYDFIDILIEKEKNDTTVDTSPQKKEKKIDE